jgi:hypothetical protein
VFVATVVDSVLFLMICNISCGEDFFFTFWYAALSLEAVVKSARVNIF